MAGVEPGDEARRRPDPAPGWSEGHRFDAWAGDGSLAVGWSVTAHPDRRRASVAGAVLRPATSPVVLVEHDIALPAARWEVRTSGLWADHVCETPLEHWSYGLEAFALVIDDPAELLGRAVGDRCPLGWELEFEAGAPAAWEGPDAYAQRGRLHGVVLVGADREEVDLVAVRRHWWGWGPPPGVGSEPPEGAVALPGPDGCWWLRPGPHGLAVHHTAG